MSSRAPVALLLALAVLALAGCSSKPRSSGRAVESWYLTVPPQRCLAEIERRGARFRPGAARVGSGGCRIDTPITLQSSTAWVEPEATLSCPLAYALSDFEYSVLQPAAQRHLGSRVIAIRQLSAYACRAIAGAGRLSEHASGRAIDVAGFELEDGTRVSVEEHWRGAGARSRFLQEVARGACGVFSLVLTPNTDRAHANHFHLDLGRWAKCDA